MISLARTPAPPARLGRSLRLALPAAALLTVLSTSAALAAPTAGSASPDISAAAASPASPATTFTWHNFTFKNGWKTAGTVRLITGHPGWAIHNGVVYLRGAIKHTGTSSDATFAVLPQAERPAHSLYIQILTLNGRPGALFVGADGVLEALGGNATTFASLGAVSFPTSAIKGHKLTLTNGWSSSESEFGTGNPSYAVSKGVVYLTGSLNGGTPGSLAFTLPKGTRPSHTTYLSIYTNNGSVGGVVKILTDGEVIIFGSAAGDFTSLANISYPAPGATWHNFKLIDHWASAQSVFGTGAPAYTVIDGVRYLGGSMIGGAAADGSWTRLPAVTRVPGVLEIEVYTVGGSNGAVALTNSLGRVGSIPFTNAQQFTSFAGIAYPPGA